MSGAIPEQPSAEENDKPQWRASEHQKWVNHYVPYFSKNEAAQLSYADCKYIIDFICNPSRYKPDPEVYDEMGWRKKAKVRYNGQWYKRGPLPIISHEELQHVNKMEDKTGFHEIARYIAEQVTGPENMSVMGQSVGMSGAGKSNGTNNILWGTGIRISDNLTGDPCNWRNPFKYWRNIKVIDKENVADLFHDIDPNSIRFTDDALNSLDRTQFMTKFMHELNTIAATERVFGGVFWASMQWEGQIDIIIRRLANLRIDFRRNPSARKYPKSLNTCKFHILDYNFYNKRNPIYTRYIHTNQEDIEDHYTGACVEEINDWYDLYRLLGAIMMKKRPHNEEEEKEIILLTPLDCHRCGKSDIYTSSRDNVKRCKGCGMRWTATYTANGCDVHYLDAGVVDIDGNPVPSDAHFNSDESFKFHKK